MILKYIFYVGFYVQKSIYYTYLLQNREKNSKVKTTVFELPPGKYNIKHKKFVLNKNF